MLETDTSHLNIFRACNLLNPPDRAKLFKRREKSVFREKKTLDTSHIPWPVNQSKLRNCNIPWLVVNKRYIYSKVRISWSSFSSQRTYDIGLLMELPQHRIMFPRKSNHLAVSTITAFSLDLGHFREGGFVFFNGNRPGLLETRTRYSH